MRDFDERCAYSCQHVSRAGGVKCMEVDHFDHTQKNDIFQRYDNLFLATRHCNGAKRDRPTERERLAGLRLLNPCREWDYGTHIFEDRHTHRLIGVTPEGKYHIRCCDLNANHLVMERVDRAKLRELLKRGMSVERESAAGIVSEAIAALVNHVERMIPEIPYC